MSKHTPGPWTQGKTNPCNVSANSALVCRTFPRGQYNTDSAEANARLIAAAPDLLDALKDALGILCRIVDGQEWGGIEDYIADMSAAIAKATGND